MTTAEIFSLSAMQARSAIVELSDHYSWETVAREMLSRMSGDEAREFLDDFNRLYAD
jgi:hypothetical protein